MMTARIAGIGAYVPENLITNDDLAKIVDTNDEWIGHGPESGNAGSPPERNAPSGGEGG